MREAVVIIIDEVSMGYRFIFEAIDRSLRFVRGIERPFGGITMVWAADWRQSLPVVPRGSRGQVVNACLRSSPLWSLAEIFKLDVNMRIRQLGENSEFEGYLLRCGDGHLDVNASQGPFRVAVPDTLRFKGSLDDLVNWVFDELSDHFQDPEWIASRGIICPTNKTVDIINSSVMGKFPGQPRGYRSFDSVDKDAHLYPTEFLNTLSPSGMPPHKMTLKIGCPVMLLRNLDPQHGHCNGTKYTVSHLHDNVIEAVVAVGAYME